MSHSISREGWYANFNSDLSGDVRFIDESGGVEMDIPCSLIKAIVANYVRGNVVALIENATDDAILISESIWGVD